VARGNAGRLERGTNERKITMTRTKTILDELYERRERWTTELEAITRNPSIYYCGDRYIADAAVCSVERARATDRLMRELARVDAAIVDESEIRYGWVA
jgi:hypothetical protein